jgi:uncharacterized membrane protein YsdA (DUF1294 family)
MSVITGPELFLAVYALMNGWAFVSFAMDKQKARANSWRTPENTLLVVAFLGPFGAFAAMTLFRHKTKKLKFYLVPVFVLLHCIGILWLITILY